MKISHPPGIRILSLDNAVTTIATTVAQINPSLYFSIISWQTILKNVGFLSTRFRARDTARYIAT